MPIPADDDVVDAPECERGGDLDDRLGHLDVRLRGRRIAGGGCAPESAARSRIIPARSDHLAGIRRVVLCLLCCTSHPRSASCACRETTGETASVAQTPCWCGNQSITSFRTIAHCAVSLPPFATTLHDRNQLRLIGRKIADAVDLAQAHSQRMNSLASRPNLFRAATSPAAVSRRGRAGNNASSSSS